MSNQFLIKKPWITEKSTDLNTMGKYVFVVQTSATKSEIKKVIKDLYKVDATAVNIVNRPAKSKRFRGIRGMKPGSGYKKAIVTLRTGQKIDVA